MRNGSYITICLILLCITLLLFSGCGSSKKDSKGDSDTGVSVVGFTVCYNCHADAVNPASFPIVFGDSSGALPGTPYTEGWISGPHGNLEAIDHSTHAPLPQDIDNDGFPYYGYFDDDTCRGCHDPLGEGKVFEDFFVETGLTVLGIINRPVIGCESCHGGGGNHYGLGPVPYEKPGPDRCGQCHSAAFPDGHLTYHPEGDNIIEEYNTSPHARSINEHTYVSGSETDVRTPCSRCHTNEGAKRYIQLVNGTEPRDILVNILDGKPDIREASVIQCMTCHDAHNPNRLIGEKVTGLSAPADGWSAEFKTCTACHQLLKTDESTNSEAYHDPSVNTHGSPEEIISDTHFDDAATVDIEGFVIDPISTHSGSAGNTNTGTCRDCHNPHNADNTINKQWAHSAHGGHIAKVKELDPAGAVTETEAPAWVHYDFKLASRAACQRCHTSTGFRNYANDTATYDPVNNVFIAKGEQREMLYCWACHKNNVGGLRNPGPITADYSNAPHTYPDVSGSNVCMACHDGRESGESIKNSTADFDDPGIRFINSHYLAAGGTVFTSTGYEYSGLDYSNVSYYAHDKIGSSGAPGTGLNGPCVGCHMGSGESHLFLPVEKDEISGIIMTITANKNICSNCHEGEHELSSLELNEEAEGFEKALDALEATLAAAGFPYLGGHPYFANGTDWTRGTGDDNVGKDNMGAAFNFNLLLHEPGAYAHNRYYAKRLIFDSIDYLDNGTLDGMIDLSSFAVAAEWYQHDSYVGNDDAVSRP
jgi:hypothetical protein